MLEKIDIICKWDEDDLKKLPSGESDIYEYKSSLIKFKDLKNKISKVASAFWNSGGGIFIAGVNNKGIIDGGISSTIGNQEIREWTDQAISATEPIGPYNIKIIKGKNRYSLIEKNKIVLVIAFGISNLVHMAYDNKYYIRSGAHSNPAGHFLVEAIRARRNLISPLLKGILKPNPQNTSVVQLLIISLNNAPALDVEITFDVFPLILHDKQKEVFPLKIPVINKNNPFTMDFYIFSIT